MGEQARKLFTDFQDTHQIIGRLADRHKEALSNAAVVRRFDNRQAVVPLGDPVDGVHFIVDGAMRLESLTESGDRLLVGDLLAGDVFGLLSVLDREPSIHHASALGDTTSVFVPADRFRAIVYADHDLMREVIEIMCQRLRMSLVMVTRFAPGSQTSRVVRCLVAIADQLGFSAPVENHATVTINQYDIAAMLSVSRQSVNRVLKELVEQGLIDVRYNQIEVLDLRRLRELQ
ncbi:MAG: Crp/Fnr family transcriptional regulator [Pseudomonadota bacterium]